jgi:hypothetical protein
VRRGQAVDLFDKENIASLAIGQQAEQLGPLEGRATLVLEVGLDPSMIW